MLILMPLFPAQPLLGPIYVQVDRFMPTDFPLLLIVPALALDLVMQRSRAAPQRLAVRRGRGGGLPGRVPRRAVAVRRFPDDAGGAQLVLRSHRMPYSVDPAMQARWYVLRPADNLAVGLPIALALGYVSARCGLWWGNWMSRVQR